MEKSYNSEARCAIILAGGEGKRLRPLIHQLRGDALPKQYVNFIGARSMLEHTYHRAEKLTDPERLFTVVGKDHLQYLDVCRQLLHRPKGTVIIQPANKDTGPGLFLSLIHVVRRYPDSVVAVFPSDHFVLEEDLFMGHVELACRAVERDSSLLVLLGVEPHGPEPEYGYILPDDEADLPSPTGIRKVLRFIEKPGSHAAQELVQRGGLWNTLVMIFKARTLLALMRRVVPVRYRSFQRVGKTLGTAQEMAVMEEIYRKMKPWNFSREMLEILPSCNSLRLSVLPMRGVFWSDWGSEIRLLSDLQRLGFIKKLYEIRSRDRRYQFRPFDSFSPLRLEE
jgi:mannose-1-phosphate guanylyltransferase